MIRKHTISIQNAWNGLIWALTSQPNYRIHFFLSGIALLVGYLLQIAYLEFLTILILIIVGLTIETVNTAIEETTDAIDTHIREDIKRAKDVSAGAMLIFAIGASIIAGVIFIPKILLLLTF
ncbi:diacylglycerol kinase [Candidatus Roizmanbacteria bacterium CG_4_10_14_0_8_um_filter_39_9]|uniref:Diacylglycerol kinase n=1 Tax=Candidatus Roizmanbacteria bacterium CG_4_10_14_0_8_um_filter_39_9 TaxID=1974829 RepID=A0A2M7QCC9_9BACT|nr:MAG: diacylglycerol kinase [Candidatus Roizmanbacteria bacterium CG_4_10_14_0_8_um_filter_39_9]